MNRRGVKTRDDFPNFLTGRVFQQSTNTYESIVINTPIPRLKTIGNRATVMELLYCDVSVTFDDFNVGGASWQFQLFLGTAQTSILAFNDTRVFMDMKRQTNDPIIQVTTVWTQEGAPFRFQFQTIDGFGYLLAADSFRAAVNTNDMIAVTITDFRLYYRFVDIPLSEFIGIVQSTQAQ